MRLFHKRKDLSPSQEQIAGKIAERILVAQREMADYLNKKTVDIATRSWLYLLIGFCTVLASYLLYLIVQAFD